MANDDEKKIKLTLENNTKAAINTITKDFLDMQKEIGKGIDTLADGTKVNTNVLKQFAKDQGISYKEFYAQIQQTAAAQRVLGGTITNVRTSGQGLTQTLRGVGNVLGSTTAGLLATAAAGVSVYKAYQFAKEGFIGYGQFETKLRLVQNQTNMTRGSIDGLGQSMKALQDVTGVAKEELLAAFEELREAGNLTPEQTMKIIPTMSKIAIGAGANIKAFGRTLGDIMRNMKVPSEQANFIMEAMSHAAKEYNINLDEVGPNLSRLTEMAQQWGYTGVDGAQRLITILGTTKEAIGDAGKSAMLLTRLLGDVGSNDQLGKALGKAPGQLYKELKAISELPGGDVIGALTGMLIAADDKEAVMKVLGVNDILVLRKLMAEWTNLGDKIRATQNAYGGVARGENVLKSPEMAVKRLNLAVTELQQAIGLLLDTIGATTVLNRFAKEVSNIAGGLEKIVLLMGWITGGDRPAGLAKSWEEAWYNATAKRDENDRPIVPFDEAQAMKKAGKNPEDVVREWESKQQRDTRRGELDVRRRVIDADKARRDELRKKYGEGSVVEPPPPGTPEPPSPTIRRRGVFQPERPRPPAGEKLPPALEKMSLAIDNVNEKLVEFAKALPDDDDRRAIIMRAGLYNYGAGPAGTGVATTGGTAAPGESPATYGGSTDAKYLKAAYTPSGQGYLGGTYGPGGEGHGPGGTGSGRAGPGGTGTSYGPQPGGLPSDQGTPGRGGVPGVPASDDLSKEAFDQMFKGTPMEGKYDKVVEEAKKNGVPPSLMAGIISHETGKGTSKMLRERNNPAGLMDPRTGMKKGTNFGTLDQGIEAAGRTIGRHYKQSGGDVNEMAKKYAPRGAANDPGGLNKSWPSGVQSAQRALAKPGGGATASRGPGPAPDSQPGMGGSGSLSMSIDEALKLEGLNETRDREILKEYVRTGGRELSGDQNAWCAAFVNSVVERAGMQGTGSWAAKSFMNWGRQVRGNEAFEKGDVFVFDRGRDPAKGHVGIHTGQTRVNPKTGETEYEMLQGNTGGAKAGGGAVGRTWHTRGQIKSVRRGQERQDNVAGAPRPAPVAAAPAEQIDPNQRLPRGGVRRGPAERIDPNQQLPPGTTPAPVLPAPGTGAPTVPPIDTGARPDMGSATLNPVYRGGGEINKEMVLNLKVNDNQVQFARRTIAREVDSQTRSARHNGYSDITVA